MNTAQAQPEPDDFLRKITRALLPKKLRMLAYYLRHADFRFENKLSRLTRSGIESFLESLAQRRVFYGTVLEIGAGGLSQNLKRFAPHATNYWRSDIRLWPQSRLELICDCTKMPFLDGSIDGIICSEVLEHVPDSKAAMLEIARVLKPEAYLAVTVPFFFPLHGVDSEDRGDYWRFAPGNLKILLGRDFELLQENRTHLFSAGDPFVLNIQMLWRRRKS